MSQKSGWGTLTAGKLPLHFDTSLINSLTLRETYLNDSRRQHHHLTRTVVSVSPAHQHFNNG